MTSIHTLTRHLASFDIEYLFHVQVIVEDVMFFTDAQYELHLSDPRIDELDNWASEHDGGFVSIDAVDINADVIHVGQTMRLTYGFEKADDAMLFKLTFGGNA